MIYLIDLENNPTRYTAQWKTHLPKKLAESGIEVSVISGSEEPQTVSEGAFLNFASTNRYKSEQIIKVTELFESKKVKDKDIFLFADAWHPGILQVRYMIELLDIEAEIHSIWHAGSYDPWDFLGRKVNKQWSYPAEIAFFEACDINYFATEFHIKLFLESFKGVTESKIVRSGLPMEYMKDYCYTLPKKDQIVFPHRMSVEKNVKLLKEVEKLLPQYKFIFCQEEGMTKDEYYKTLAESKVVWSGSYQETLGIGMMEGWLSECRMVVPECLSYAEMYGDELTYNPSMRDGPAQDMAQLIKFEIESYGDDFIPQTAPTCGEVFEKYFSSDIMLETLKQRGTHND